MVGKAAGSHSYSCHLPNTTGAAADASHSYSSFRSSAASPPFREKSTCRNTAAEFACSACLFCVCCPISITWCCFKVPCEVGWRLAKRAKRCDCFCGSQKKISAAAYSSFSDIDSDDETPLEHVTLKSKTLNPIKNRWKANR